MSTTLDVVFQHRATRDIEEINAWWRDNRPAAPDLFVLELRATVSIAALSPMLGLRRAMCDWRHSTADLAANAVPRVLPGSWTGARDSRRLACGTRQRAWSVATDHRRSRFNSAPQWIRTTDLRLRRPSLSVRICREIRRSEHVLSSSCPDHGREQPEIGLGRHALTCSTG